jgi:hypothetical protein
VAECGVSGGGHQPEQAPALPDLHVPNWLDVRERVGAVGSCAYRASDAEAESAMRSWLEEASIDSDVSELAGGGVRLNWWAGVDQIAAAVLAVREGTADLPGSSGGSWLPKGVQRLPQGFLERIERAGAQVSSEGSDRGGWIHFEDRRGAVLEN